MINMHKFASTHILIHEGKNFFDKRFQTKIIDLFVDVFLAFHIFLVKVLALHKFASTHNDPITPFFLYEERKSQPG